jgi:hypothetical protein
MSEFVTGYGSMDTHAVILNDGRENPHVNAGKPYGVIPLQQIYTMVANPPTTAKELAQWVVPSSYNGHDGRSHEAQRDHGEFWMHALDIDKGDPSMDDVVTITKNIIGDCCFVVYSTRSSTEGNRKWRVLIPIGALLLGKRYTDFQDALFDAFTHFGLTLDSTLRRTGQLVYLPNRGEWYEWCCHGTELFDPQQHAQLTARADEYQAVQQQVLDNHSDPKTGPFIAQFNEDIETLLLRYNFTRKGDSDHWRSPYSESGGYPFQNRGDHWISLSHTDGAQKLGKATANGSRYGDAFDLYTHFEHQGDLKAAVKSLKGLIYGAADAGILLDYTDPDTGEFWDVFPNPNRPHGNGYDLAQIVIQNMERDKAQAEADRKEEIKRSEALVEAATVAENNQWGGEWTKQVPFAFKPTALEWAAWHAPGCIGMAIRARAIKTSRFTLVPILAGTVAAVAHMGQGKFVSRHRQHKTPTTVMMFVVGESGSGKGDSTGMFYDMLALVDKTRIKAYRTKSFASGQSLTDYLMHHNSDVMMIQQEGGAGRKAGKGDAHFESLMAGVTETFTAFDHGIEVTHTKSDEKEGKQVNHPSVAALMSSTPKKLFASIDVADSESGWLGRNVFLPLPLTRTNLAAAPDVTYPPELKRILNWIVETIPPLAGVVHPEVWQGTMQAFHALHFTPDAAQMIDDINVECDNITIDQRRPDVERAVFNRGAETVNRLATVAALAKGGLAIDAECVVWAKLIMLESAKFVLSQTENMVEEEVNDTPQSRIRRKIKDIFKRSDMDEGFAKKLRVPARRNARGEVEITLSSVKRKARDDCKASARMVNEVIQEMQEEFEILGSPPVNNMVWMRWLG